MKILGLISIMLTVVALAIPGRAAAARMVPQHSRRLSVVSRRCYHALVMPDCYPLRALLLAFAGWASRSYSAICDVGSTSGSRNGTLTYGGEFKPNVRCPSGVADLVIGMFNCSQCLATAPPPNEQ